jgi:hypothetical protein
MTDIARVRMIRRSSLVRDFDTTHASDVFRRSQLRYFVILTKWTQAMFGVKNDAGYRNSDVYW